MNENPRLSLTKMRREFFLFVLKMTARVNFSGDLKMMLSEELL